MDHGSRVLGAAASGTEQDKVGPSHGAGLDVLMVTWSDGPKLPSRQERPASMMSRLAA